MDNIAKILARYGIVPSLEKDQIFLRDEKVAKNLVDVAKIGKEDIVLEIGPGLGIITRILASRAKKVITIEIDIRFKPILQTLPSNVKIIYGDAYKLLNNQKFLNKIEPPTKMVSNIPYSQAQNILHNFTNSWWYQKDLVWLAPISLVNKINSEPILGAYFNAEVKKLVPKSAFYPQPKTSSAIIIFKRIPDPKKTKNFGIYFRRWLYNHKGWKVKNALRESLIQAALDLKGVKVTKNQARKLISQLKIPKEEQEKPTGNLKPHYYSQIPNKLEEWFNGL